MFNVICKKQNELQKMFKILWGKYNYVFFEAIHKKNKPNKIFYHYGVETLKTDNIETILFNIRNNHKINISKLVFRFQFIYKFMPIY